MSAWVLAGVIVTGAWTQLDEIGWLAVVPLAIALWLDRDTHDVRPITIRRFTRRSLGEGRAVFAATAPMAAAALLCALHLAHVLLTAREEFNFGGDEGYQLSATRAFVLYYVRAAPFLLVSLAVFFFARWKGWRYAASMAVAVLLLSSFFLPASALFGRYPAGFYHLAAPLNVAFEAARVPYPFTPNHIMNALSVPAWLFLLRPSILGRWPDWQVLPAALLMYFQAPALLYVGGAVLEPWAFVFLLLALEALVVLPAGDRWLAVLLASAGTFFKESAILLLPTIWVLAGRPFVAGVAAVTPFALYYFVRLDAEVQRIVATVPPSEIWNAARIAEWLTNASAQLGVTALIAVAFVFAGTLRHLLWTLTALAIAVFFLADAQSVPYTGYGRFLAYSLLALCGGLFATTYRIANRRSLAAISAVIAALQAPPVARTFALDFRPDYERNSLEWAHTPIRAPIRTLIERMPSPPGGPPATIRLVSFGIDLTSLPVAYPDLADRFDLRAVNAEASAAECACRDNTEAVLAVFEWPAHFAGTPEARSAFGQQSASCVERVQATCRVYEMERDGAGAAVGVIGAGLVR